MVNSTVKYQKVHKNTAIMLFEEGKSVYLLPNTQKMTDRYAIPHIIAKGTPTPSNALNSTNTRGVDFNELVDQYVENVNRTLRCNISATFYIKEGVHEKGTRDDTGRDRQLY